MRDRHRTQPELIDETENRNIRPNAQRQSDNGHGREAGELPQQSPAVTNVAQEVRHHSYLNATMGSTFEALHAGTQQANVATTINSSATPENVNGSVALTP